MVNPGNPVQRKPPAFQRMYFGSPYNLIHTGRSGDLQKYYQQLCNFDFLLGKIQHPEFGVQLLIEDYDLLDDPEAEKHSDYNPEAVKALRLIQGALRLSAHVLVEEPTQLASQLWGRLQDFDMPELQSLLQQAKQNQTVWLRPLKSSLFPPGKKLLRILTGHQGSVNAIAVTSDGKQAVSGLEDGTLKVWDLATGEGVATLIGHSDSINAVAVTLDGKQAVSGSEDGTLKVWDLTKKQKLLTLAQNQFPVKTVVVSSDGKWVTSANSLGVKRWNLETRKSKVLLSLEDMREIVLEEKAKKWWEFWKLDLIEVDVSVNTVTLTPDGTTAILCLNIDKTVTGTIWTGGGQIPVRNVIHDTTLWIRNLETAEGFDINRSQNHGHTTAIAVTPDSKKVISGSRDKTIKVWDIETRRQLFTLKGHKNWIASVAVSLDGQYLISGSKDKTLKVWNLKTRTELFTLTGHSSPVTAVAVTPDGSRAISGSSDSSLKVWDLETREAIVTINGHHNAVEAIALTPDGRHLISAASDRKLKVWNLLTEEERASFTADSALTSCIVAPDGLTIIAGDQAGQLHFLYLEGIELKASLCPID